jgi:hypothetical protein
MGFFARLVSAHGQYQIEVQLQTPDGNTVWRDGPPDPWTLANPLSGCPAIISHLSRTTKLFDASV